MKTCIITGASDGIGRSTSIELSNMNEFDNLVLIGRSIAKLEETKCKMNNLPNIALYEYDLCDLDKIPALIEDIYLKYKTIDCLINIAGYTDPQPLLHTTKENLLTTYTVNVFAPILLMRECVRYMRKNSISKILNVGSTAGITPRPGWLSYASSKAAIIASSQTLGEELAEYNIKVYTISPGRCATALRRKLAPNEEQSKIMQPSEVADVICRLVSDDEKCLDGQNIIVRKK